MSDRRTGCGVAPLPLACCDAAWRASAWRHSVSICLEGREGFRVCQRGIQRGIRGGETDASVVARDAKIWAPRVGGAHLRSVRALEARVVAHARTRTSRHRPRTRRHRRPAGTSPSRGGKGADALPTRARTHGARDVLRFERGECTLRFASRAPELTTELCRSTRKLHKLAWHSEGREGGIAPRSRCARSRPPPSDASWCPARSLGRCPEDVPAARYFTTGGG